MADIKMFFLFFLLSSCSLTSNKLKKQSNLFEVKAKDFSVVVQGNELVKNIKIINLSSKSRGSLKEIVCKIKNIGEKKIKISYKYIWRKQGDIKGFAGYPWLTINVLPKRDKTIRAVGKIKAGYKPAIYIK